jgi:hypothetical protein
MTVPHLEGTPELLKPDADEHLRPKDCLASSASRMILDNGLSSGSIASLWQLEACERRDPERRC